MFGRTHCQSVPHFFNIITPADTPTEIDRAKKDPTQYLVTVEQMIENDYTVPFYLADVFSKLDGWVETPETDADADVDAKSGDQSATRWIARWCVLQIAYSVSYTDKD